MTPFCPRSARSVSRGAKNGALHVTADADLLDRREWLQEFRNTSYRVTVCSQLSCRTYSRLR